MTTLTSIINSAFREGGIVAVGDTPGTNEAAEALPILINLINSIFHDELGEFLTIYNVGSNGVTYPSDCDHTVSLKIPANSRLICNLSSPTTLYLPPAPEDGTMVAFKDNRGNFATNPLTIDGNGRLVNGGYTAVLNTNSYGMTWIYLIDSGQWAPIPSLSLGSDFSPFPSIYDDMLSIMLLVRIAPRYGASVAEETLSTLNRLKKKFKTQYKVRKEQNSEIGLLYLTRRRFAVSNSFNKGS